MSQQVPGPPGPHYPPPGQPWPQGQPGPPQDGQGFTVPRQVWPQGQPQFGPTGTVALTIQGSEMTSNMIVPTVTVNGHRINTRYGRQDIPVPPGPVHIEASAQWMRTYGQAAMSFTLQAGQLVPVFYAAPMHQFTTGSMGHEKQKRKGVVGFIGFLGFVMLVVAAGIAVPALLMS